MDKAYKIDLVALAGGSVNDFDMLFTSYYPRVKSFLRSMLLDNDEAEDLAQDAFMRLWQNRELLRDVHNLNAYVYQTVKYVLYTYLDKCKNAFTTEIDAAVDIPSYEEVENIVCSRELEELLEKAIDRMPPQRKQVFCMSRKQGLSTEEISQRLGISKRTVETHISLALSMLRKIISTFIILFHC